MKTKILILAMAIMLSGNAKGQGMPVYDNTNFISLAKSLIESAKQTSQLLKTVNFLKDQKENIEKVFDKGKDFVEDLVEGDEVVVEDPKIAKSVEPEAAPEVKKSARDRFKDKGMIK